MEKRAFSRRIQKIPRIYRISVIIVLNILIVSGLFNFVIKPNVETERRLATELQDLDRKFQSLTNINRNIDNFRREYMELRNVFEETMKELPEAKDVPNLLRSVSNLGTETKIKVKYFEPKPPLQKEFYAEFPFEIKFTGPYHNIGYFFDGIRREKRIIHVVNFTLEAKGPASQALVLDGSCTAKTYVYTPEKPIEGKKVETPTKK
ncbi:MAG: type 4a pilus biogenesis protein PilO [Deltaproteobacteria bacterium]|nr:type 4a pilus biogenesis protein PilO [Deltaproteobacteria bacterium]